MSQENLSRNLRKDIEYVVLATMLDIIYAPKRGKRDDFCYSVACILGMKWGKWEEEKINYFIETLADNNLTIRRKFGTKAYKGNRPKGLPTLKRTWL